MGTTLDVAIGLISIYLLLSVLCSAVHEAAAGFLRLRARNLAHSIDKLLGDPALGVAEAPAAPKATLLARVEARLPWRPRRRPRPFLVDAFQRHPLIKALQHGWVGPSYIPSHTFVAAFLDSLRDYVPPRAPERAADVEAAVPAPDRHGDPLGEARALIARLPDGSELKRALGTILDGTVKDMRDANARLERWFNDAMDRAAGRYKRRSQLLITTSALTLCVGFNADTLALANALARDAAVRARAIAVAQDIARAPRPDDSATAALRADARDALVKGGDAKARIEELDLDIRWGSIEKKVDRDPPRLWAAAQWLLGDGWGRWARGVFARLTSPGILVTAAAASLGAPFWFDLLNKLVNLRTAGKPPDP